MKAAIWIIVLFSVATALTMELNAAHDGMDKLGFPLTFYDHFSGKCHGCHKNFGFKLPSLVIDLGLTTMVVFIAMTIRRLNKTNA